jgi:hypothetical protein
MSQGQANSKKKSLREKILFDIPDSGLKVDGNLTVRECEAILDYLEDSGLKTSEEKIAFVREQVAALSDDFLREAGVKGDNVDQIETCIKGKQWLLESTSQLNSISESIGAISSSLMPLSANIQKMFNTMALDPNMQKLQRDVNELSRQMQCLSETFQFAQYSQSYLSLMSDVSRHIASINANLVISPSIPNIETLVGQWQNAVRDLTTVSSMVKFASDGLDKWHGTQLLAANIELIGVPKDIDEGLQESKRRATRWQARLTGPEFRDNPEEDLRQANQVIGILLAHIQLLKLDLQSYTLENKKLREELSKPKELEDDRHYG